MFKIALTGKGGVGKTTISALLCYSFQRAGYRILAVDADPDANLAATLGFPDPENIKPISEMGELIAERTGTKSENKGIIFKLNPRVDDIPMLLGTVYNDIRLLVMGRIKKAGSGCYCPENAFVKELIGHLLLEKNDVVILDMEAGIEHLGRGTAGDVDYFLIIVEPSKRSVESSKRIIGLVKDLKIKRYHIIGNKIQNEDDRNFIISCFPDETITGFIQYSDFIKANSQGDNGTQLKNVSFIDSIRDTLIQGAVNGK